MKSFKRIIALVVALMLTLALVSCGGDETSKNDASTASKAEVSTSDKSEAASEATSEAASEATSGDASVDTSVDASEGASEDVSEDVSEETSSLPEGKALAKAVYGTPAVDALSIDPLWDSAPKFTGEKIRYTAGTNNENLAIQDTYTRFTFQVMWDETHLYILERVTDLTIGGFDPNLTWQNDSTEIQLSLKANQEPNYDLEYDGWIGISPQEVTYYDGRAYMFGEDLAYVDYSTDYDNTGYVVCVAFDIASIASDVEWKEGHTIGLEITVNDAVNPGERACCVAWANDEDKSFENPSLMGLVQLVNKVD